MNIVTRLAILIAFIMLNTTLSSQDCAEDIGFADNLSWYFEAPDTDIVEGDTFAVTCMVDNFEEVLSFQYTINFDPTVLKFLSIDNTGSPLIGLVNINPTPSVLDQGYVGLLWTNGNGVGQTLDSNVSIYTLHFEAIGNPGNCADFQINSSFVPLEIAFENTDGSICTEIDNINYDITFGDICLVCDDQTFISSNLCNGELEFSVCGGIPPYNFTIGGFNLQDQGTLDAEEIISYSDLENEGLITISVSDAAGNNTVLSLANESHIPLEIFGDPICEFGELSAPDNFTDYEWINPDGERFTTDLDEPWIVEVTQGGLYTLYATFEDCRESTNFFLEQTEALALLENQFTVCNSAGTQPSSIILDSIITNSTGSFWSSSDMSNPLDILNFEGVDPGNYSINVYAEAFSPCANEQFEIIIQVLECGCPELNVSPIGNHCNEEETILNLFDFLSPDTPVDGIFSILRSEGDLADIQPDVDGILIIDQNFIAGDYSLRYQLDMAPAGCTDINIEPFSIFASPTPIIINPDTLCNSDNSNFPTTLDLSQFILEAEGAWQDDNGNNIDDTVVDFTGADPGIYEFIFTTTEAQAPCPNVSVSLQAQVIDCSIVSTQDLDLTDLNIYPNPNNGIFNIDAQGKWDIFIYDLTGVLVLKQTIEPGVNLIRLDSKSKGLYLAECYDQGRLLDVKKVIVH